jgi:hypothetical protein
MKKVIRLTESQLIKTLKKIIKETELNELGQGDFSDIEEIGCVEPIGKLHVGITTMSKKSNYRSGFDFIVVYFNNEKTNEQMVYGFGPQVTDNMFDKKDYEGTPIICRIAERTLMDFSEQYNENEVNF